MAEPVQLGVGVSVTGHLEVWSLNLIFRVRVTLLLVRVLFLILDKLLTSSVSYVTAPQSRKLKYLSLRLAYRIRGKCFTAE